MLKTHIYNIDPLDDSYKTELRPETNIFDLESNESEQELGTPTFK